MKQSIISKNKYLNALKIIQILEEGGYATRFVGGCVRDRYLNQEPLDYDLASVALPEVMLNIFKAQNLKVIPTGIEHGTLTVLTNTGPVEVTTLRKDINTDGRHAEVEYSDSFEEDAKRRDFTMNAMSMNAEGKIYDYFDGVKDLDLKLIRFVGDTETRIREDYLRILRYFRFMARFQFKPIMSDLEIIKKTKQGLHELSSERVTGELTKLFSYKELSKPLQYMDETGVFFELFQLDIGLKGSLYPLLLKADSIPDRYRAISRYAIIAREYLHKNRNKILTDYTQKLRLSNKEKKMIEAVFMLEKDLSGVTELTSSHLYFVDALEALAGKSSFKDFLYDLGCIIGADSQKLKMILFSEELKGYLRHKKMPITGQDVMQSLNLQAGEELGKILKSLKIDYYDGVWSTKKEGLKRIKS